MSSQFVVRPAGLKPLESVKYSPIAWRRIYSHPLFMPYNRLAIAVVALNLILGKVLTSFDIMDFVLGNFAVATLIRQQYIINLLFAMATSVPTSAPLSLRWACGKIYHFGGIHVGCFVSGLTWLFMYTFKVDSGANILLKLTLYTHLFILLTMAVVALPAIRARYHNQFEVIGRFGLWTSLVLFAIQMVLEGKPPTIHVITLGLVAVSVILPWLRLKKVEVRYERPSGHVVLASFDYGVTPFAGSSTDISLNPLTEWHSFANVPVPGENGYKLTISRAGDWTGELIDRLPKSVWVKGIPTAGVGNIETLFKRVVWVATGSGIGPCLPHLLAAQVPSTLVWSTRNPDLTYGKELVEKIGNAQPEALIWDTDKFGKPDLVALALEEVERTKAEAVICISNKKVTWNVVYELESRGIPAFGAIWDS